MTAAAGRGWVRLAFAAAACLWGVQAALIGAGLGEPYPGIIMPGFTGPGGHSGRSVELTRLEAVFVANTGERRSVSQRTLLAEFPDSHHGSMAGSFLAPPGPAKPPRLQKWLRRHLLPGLAAGQTDRTAPCSRRSLREWARSRGAVLFPGAALDRVEFRWHRDTFVDGVAVRRESAGTVAIPFSRGEPCVR